MVLKHGVDCRLSEEGRKIIYCETLLHPFQACFFLSTIREEIKTIFLYKSFFVAETIAVYSIHFVFNLCLLLDSSV